MPRLTNNIDADGPERDTATALVAGDVNGSPPDPAVESAVRMSLMVGVLLIAIVAGLVGWLGFRTYQARAEAQQQAMFLQLGRQTALNLSTLDYTQIDTDVQRILDSSTGGFHDDFSNASRTFIDSVKQAQSKAEGTIIEAALTSVQPDRAQVLVAVSVKGANAAPAQQQSRAWRLRIDVQKVGDATKVSNVEFVS